MATLFTSVLASCATSRQARNLDLDDPSMPRLLTKGMALSRSDTDEEALYVYRNPIAPTVKYTKLLLDPVVISKQGELNNTQLANYQALADNAFQLVRKELSQDFEVVTESSTGTLRIQIAILDAEAAAPVRRLLASAVPVSAGISLVKYIATGKPSAVGQIAVEILVTDALSGKILGAAVDSRVGTQNLSDIVDPWATANEAIAIWATRLHKVLKSYRHETHQM